VGNETELYGLRSSDLHILHTTQGCRQSDKLKKQDSMEDAEGQIQHTQVQSLGCCKITHHSTRKAKMYSCIFGFQNA